MLYLRYQDSNGNVGLHNGVPLMLDGLEIHTSWRNGPACAHINGKMAIVTSDEEDQVHLYYRLDNYNLIDGGKMMLRDPKTGKLHNIGPVNYLKAGATGRLKYTLCDFNDDGHLDLILGTNGLLKHIQNNRYLSNLYHCQIIQIQTLKMSHSHSY